MKRHLFIFATSLLLISALASCQSADSNAHTNTEAESFPQRESVSESEIITEPETITETETTTQEVETVPSPPSDETEGESMMESISTYQNPILTAATDQAWPSYGFGDPFVMRHNGMYYLYCSTKDGSVGIKCWSSPDLVNWKYEGFCSNDLATRGAYAPEVYYYNGYFYMYTSPAGNGHYVLRSTSPTKGFKVVTPNMGMTIDGSIFVDNNGKWYFYNAGGGAMQVYDMVKPTQMRNGRSLPSISVNGGWTEGGMVVYHDGYYYMTYTGNHVLSPSYRILYGVSDHSPLDFDRATDHNPLLISTEDAVFGIGHSSTVKGPDLDSYYIVYHSLVDTLPNRNMNIDRIWFNGDRMEILGPTTDPQQVPELPDVYHRFEPGASLKGWSLQGSLSKGSGLPLAADSLLISKTPFAGDFTAEYNVTFIAEGGQAGALFAYTDPENFGACYFSPAEQKVIIEITVAGQTTRTEVDTIRSFNEDTRFDCLQALQIERSGKDYTFYMNDRFLCVIQDSALTSGSIGYITKGAEASFGFIGGTQAVGGHGGADQYKTVSEQVSVIPATDALEAFETVTLSGGRKSVAIKNGNTLSYRILAAKNGTYDLSVLCHSLPSNGIGVELLVDGKQVTSGALSAAENGTATLILRNIDLTEGQHVLSLKWNGSVSVERLCMLKAAAFTEISQDYENSKDDHRYSDGGWQIKGGALTMSSGSAFGKRLYGSSNMGDYTAEVKVTPRSSPNCGLLVRATNPGSPNFLGTQASAEDAITATDWVMGYFVGLSPNGVILGKQSYGYREIAHADGTFRSDETYTLKVECQGATIRVFVDGKLYITYTDPEPFMQGMVGVRTHNCTAVFDDLTVKSDDGSST